MATQQSVLNSLDLIYLNGRDEEVRSLVAAHDYNGARAICIDLHRETVPLARYKGAEKGEFIQRQRSNLLRLAENLDLCQQSARFACPTAGRG